MAQTAAQAKLPGFPLGFGIRSCDHFDLYCQCWLPFQDGTGPNSWILDLQHYRLPEADATHRDPSRHFHMLPRLAPAAALRLRRDSYRSNPSGLS